MIVYRISVCRYISDLSGTGAAMGGGRWNSKGVYVVYTAQSRALALLETVVHMGRMPEKGYCMATIEIPDHSMTTFTLDMLPPGWNNQPAPDFLKAIGDRFIKAGEYMALKIPSVLMMEENNILLNPAHPDFRKVKILTERSLHIDERLFHA